MKYAPFVAVGLALSFLAISGASATSPSSEDSTYLRPRSTPLPSEYEWIESNMEEPVADAFAGLITGIINPDANVSALLARLFEPLPEEVPVCYGFIFEGTPMAGLVEITEADLPESFGVRIAGYGVVEDDETSDPAGGMNELQVGGGYYYARYNPNVAQCNS